MKYRLSFCIIIDTPITFITVKINGVDIREWDLEMINQRIEFLSETEEVVSFDIMTKGSIVPHIPIHEVSSKYLILK